MRSLSKSADIVSTGGNRRIMTLAVKLGLQASETWLVASVSTAPDEICPFPGVLHMPSVCLQHDGLQLPSDFKMDAINRISTHVKYWRQRTSTIVSLSKSIGVFLFSVLTVLLCIQVLGTGLEYTYYEMPWPRSLSTSCTPTWRIDRNHRNFGDHDCTIHYQSFATSPVQLKLRTNDGMEIGYDDPKCTISESGSSRCNIGFIPTLWGAGISYKSKGTVELETSPLKRSWWMWLFCRFAATAILAWVCDALTYLIIQGCVAASVAHEVADVLKLRGAQTNSARRRSSISAVSPRTSTPGDEVDPPQPLWIWFPMFNRFMMETHGQVDISGTEGVDRKESNVES